ncbi:MAG TPA: nucleotidyltransferase family protein [Candidatus Saccharimonadales bacterium]|nr:nucleotidyltransferase family protein [Candidatus Saccharimonadales bacterium]
MSEIAIGVIILAAGASTRMGEPKLLLRWGDTTMLGQVVRVWKCLRPEQIAVVHGAGDTPITEELDRLAIQAWDRIPNANPGEGMFSSVRCAALWKGWQTKLTHWAIVLGDQPHLDAALLAAVICYAERHPKMIVQPGLRGRPRHPVILPLEEFLELRQSKEPTLKAFLEKRKVKLYELENDSLDFDIDTPDDYQRGLKQFPPS